MAATYLVIGVEVRDIYLWPTLRHLSLVHGKSQKYKLSFQTISRYWDSYSALDRMKTTNCTCSRKNRVSERPGTVAQYTVSFQWTSDRWEPSHLQRCTTGRLTNATTSGGRLLMRKEHL